MPSREWKLTTSEQVTRGAQHAARSVGEDTLAPFLFQGRNLQV